MRRVMRWAALEAPVLAAALSLSACATTDSGRLAHGANAADLATTVAALQVPGAAELSGWWIFPLKHAVIVWADGQPCAAREQVHAIATASGFGAAANNALVAMFAPSPVIAIPVGLAVAIYTYRKVKDPCPAELTLSKAREVP